LALPQADDFDLLLREEAAIDLVQYVHGVRRLWSLTHRNGLEAIEQTARFRSTVLMDIACPFSTVSRRRGESELGVFRMIARGLSNPEIGRELYISETTVKTTSPTYCTSSTSAIASRRSCWHTKRGSSTPTSGRGHLATTVRAKTARLVDMT